MNRVERRALEFGRFSFERSWYNDAQVVPLSVDRDEIDGEVEAWLNGPRPGHEHGLCWAQAPTLPYVFYLDEQYRRVDK